MDIVRSATRIVTQTANVTTAAAGAVGGAAINGVVGGVQGTVSGMRDGATNGSHSTPAALLTLGAVGAAGLVEWPLLLGVGGTALVVHQLNRRTGAEADTGTDGQRPARSANRTAPAKKSSSRARKSSPRKATKATRR